MPYGYTIYIIKYKEQVYLKKLLHKTKENENDSFVLLSFINNTPLYCINFQQLDVEKLTKGNVIRGLLPLKRAFGDLLIWLLSIIIFK